jgi:hypothetical protein
MSLLESPLRSLYEDPGHLAVLRSEFLRADYVGLPQFLTPPAFRELHRQVLKLADLRIRRDFIMPGVATPRRLSTVGGKTIAANAPDLVSLYHSSTLSQLVQAVCGSQIYPCRHPSEYLVANFLDYAGSTHGWHLDDPALALIVFVESPPATDGGLLELIPAWESKRSAVASPEASIEESVVSLRQQGQVTVKHHQVGDAYLLRADRCLHRVTELRNPRNRRIALNFAFELFPVTRYGTSATLLYD